MSRVTSIENIIHFLLKGHIMQISMKCSIAVHCLIFIHEVKGTAKVTSNLLAKSTGCNPVIIRQHLQFFKKGRHHHCSAGNRRCRIVCRPFPDHTISDLYCIRTDGLASLIGIHPCQDRPCPVAQNIRKVLQTPYNKIEDSIKETMESITLQSMIDEFDHIVNPLD